MRGRTILFFDELTSAELIEQHRDLNQYSGAKAHLATPEIKRDKLRLKEEMLRRAQNGCNECRDYLELHGNVMSTVESPEAEIIVFDERRHGDMQSVGDVAVNIVNKVAAVRS